jgi:hypothetical protein
MAKSPETPAPADTESVDAGWDDDALAEDPGAVADKKKRGRKPASQEGKKPKPRQMLPTLPDFDPLAHDVVDEGRPTLPVINPLFFDKDESKD